VHYVLVLEVAVREHDLVNLLALDQLLELRLEPDRDAAGVLWAGQLSGEALVVDAG
jgi:hypothetical protein